MEQPVTVTYEDWVTWDEKVWRSPLNTFDYPADYEDEWIEAPAVTLPPEIYVRVDEPPGPHWREKVRRRHFRKLHNFMKNGEDWILVEPFLVADTAGRWIVLGNFLHKVSLYSGFLANFICWMYPQQTQYLWTSTIVSVGSALAYFIFARDPVSNYQVEEDKYELSRFPMKSFRPMKPKVFRRVGHFANSLAHRLLAGISLTWALYYWKNPPPFCYCGWGDLESFRPDLK